VEGAVHDQLAATLEEVEEGRFAFGPVEDVRLLDGQPGHAPALGGQRVTGAGVRLLFYEQVLACGLPLFARHDVVLHERFLSCGPVLSLSTRLLAFSRERRDEVEGALDPLCQCRGVETAYVAKACCPLADVSTGLNSENGTRTPSEEPA
jgi:hypothetical protein